MQVEEYAPKLGSSEACIPIWQIAYRRSLPSQAINGQDLRNRPPSPPNLGGTGLFSPKVGRRAGKTSVFA